MAWAGWPAVVDGDGEGDGAVGVSVTVTGSLVPWFGPHPPASPR
jgi:hypothetical protein